MNYMKRIHNLQQILNHEGVDGILVQELIALNYLTGLELSAGLLYVPSSGTPHLLVDGRYIQMAKKRSPFPASLMTQGGFDEFLKVLSEQNHHVIGFDSAHTTYDSFLSLNEKISGLGGRSKLVPMDNPVGRIRQIKDEEEIHLLREAAILGSKGYDFVTSLLEEGITEKEVVFQLEMFWRKEGGERLAFDPIIAFGANTSMPHYRPKDVALEKDQPVLIDI